MKDRQERGMCNSPRTELVFPQLKHEQIFDGPSLPMRRGGQLTWDREVEPAMREIVSELSSGHGGDSRRPRGQNALQSRLLLAMGISSRAGLPPHADCASIPPLVKTARPTRSDHPLEKPERTTDPELDEDTAAV